MNRVIFDEIKLQAKKSGKCHCGRRLTRSKTFSQTENPFNLKPNGWRKSISDIRAELTVEAEAWKKLPMICQICADIEP